MNVLLIISYICFHYPLALLKDIKRRYDRMKLYNPERASIYDFENGSPFSSFNNSTPGYMKIIFVSSYILSLIPAFVLFDINWFVIILINIGVTFVSPFIAFITHPFMSISSISRVAKISFICIALGIVFFIIGMSE